MTHTILRQYIHVDLKGRQSDGLALQNRLPELCNDWLTPVLERVLDRVATPGVHLHIDRLEIDAGAFSPEMFEAGFPAAVERALEKALSECLPPHAAQGQQHETGHELPAHFKTERQVALEAFLHFLETGRLPWSFRLPSGATLEQYLTTLRSGGSGPFDFSAPLSIALRAPVARRRLVAQFSIPFLDAVMHDLSTGFGDAVHAIQTALGSQAATVPARYAQNTFEKHLWETAFELAASGNETPGVPALIARSVAAAPEAATGVLPALKDLIKASLPVFVRMLREQAGADFALIEPGLKAVFEAEMPGLSETTPGKSPSSKQPKHFRRRSAESPGESAQTPVAGEREDDAGLHYSRTDTATLPEEGFYISNAGLIILHPFLQMFFEGLDIAREGALLQPGRALHLLHFLCTGQTPAPEYELLFPKILCNINPGTPVDLGIVLTDKEMEESGVLLASAIRWWEALGNTGPDALRGTFLCRSGKLSLRDDGDWLLQVERQAFDVLLDHLPWGISAVKLPWMEKVVWVEWGWMTG